MEENTDFEEVVFRVDLEEEEVDKKIEGIDICYPFRD